MQEAVAEYAERHDARDRFDRDTIGAWQDYEETGHHLTHEEVDAWLARLEAGEDVDPPAPHA